MKRCTKCGVEKPFSEYYNDRAKKDGLHSQCKSCHSVRAKAYQNSEARPRILESARRRRQAEPEKYKRIARNSVLKKKYGITVDEYEELLKVQGSMCAICGSTDSRGWGRLHVDHCHKTGKVRGILCQGCNTSLGKFGDNPMLLRKAADYLEGK